MRALFHNRVFFKFKSSYTVGANKNFLHAYVYITETLSVWVVTQVCPVVIKGLVLYYQKVATKSKVAKIDGDKWAWHGGTIIL